MVFNLLVYDFCRLFLRILLFSEKKREEKYLMKKKLKNMNELEVK
jgi:hypothetical protein